MNIRARNHPSSAPRVLLPAHAAPYEFVPDTTMCGGERAAAERHQVQFHAEYYSRAARRAATPFRGQSAGRNAYEHVPMKRERELLPTTNMCIVASSSLIATPPRTGATCTCAQKETHADRYCVQRGESEKRDVPV